MIGKLGGTQSRDFMKQQFLKDLTYPAENKSWRM